MRGKWAAGIAPKHFTWIFPGKFAISERPGGFTANHRRVRRQEEIIWLEGQEFTRIVSLLGTPHNLAAYDERKIASSNFEIPLVGEPGEALFICFQELERALDDGEKVLLHHDELSEVTLGVLAGFLVWSQKTESGPQSIAVTERLTGRPLGPVARRLVAASLELPVSAS
jgi:hypothetical protein